MEPLMIQCTKSSVKHTGGSVMAWQCMAAIRTSSLVFTDDVTEVYRALQSARIQPDAAKLHSTDGSQRIE